MHWLGHFLTPCISVLWALGAGHWALELGIGHWVLGVGAGTLGTGALKLGSGSWALELGARHGIWALGVRRWAPGAPAKSKVVTSASFYALALMFTDPVQSCATIRGLCRELQQKVKW